jgi:hypothetical protein
MQQSAVPHLDDGDHNPTIETLMRIARRLDVDVHGQPVNPKI